MSKTIAQLPAGSKVIEGSTKYYNSIIPWIVLEHGHDGASNTTLLAEKILTLKCFDAKEPSNSNTDRKLYGNNRYSVSNIRQWLNSDAAAGNWYSAQHTADAPPDSSNVYNNENAYNSQAGFLNGFSVNFKALLQNVTKTVVLNTVTDGGGSETVTNKIFLLSRFEVGLGKQNNIAEGTQYAYFTDAESRKCKCTAEAIANSNYTSNPTVNDNWIWWLRTCQTGTAKNPGYVSENGTFDSRNAYYGSYGVRPACSIPSDTKVSDDPNQDGYYEIYGYSPVISGSNSNLGRFYEEPAVTYSIIESEDSVSWIKESIDGVVTRTITTPTIGTEYTFDLSSWNSLDNGSHTLVIQVQTENGYQSERVYAFTKLYNHLEFKTEADETDAAAEAVLLNLAYIGAGINVKVCNNAYDDSPTWEDMTEDFLAKRSHEFTNTTKTGTKWGIQFHVTITKSSTVKDVSCTTLQYAYK